MHTHILISGFQLQVAGLGEFMGIPDHTHTHTHIHRTRGGLGGGMISHPVLGPKKYKKFTYVNSG